MITELSAQNFKSWKDTSALQFAPLTGFFGANSSGKSSILQVLLMLKQTVERPSDWIESLYLGDDQSLVNLGTFNDVIHRPVRAPALGISLSWELQETSARMTPHEFNTLSFHLNFFNTSVGSFNFQVDRVNERTYGIQFREGKYELNMPDWNDSFDFIFRCYGIRGASARTQSIFSNLEKAFEDLFSRIRYLGPRREDPRRNYKWVESHPNDVGQYGEKMISALLSSRVRLRSTDEQIMKWLQRLELIYSYDINPTSNTEQDYELLAQQYKDGPKVGLTDVGFGVSQVLPLLALCYYADEGSILIIEQPEAHLHPKVQSDLADVLIDVVKNRNVQIILESHSEHLLHRLTRRIAEEKLFTEDTALYFCQMNDGKSDIEQLEIDEYGNISNWPQNFFGDEMGDLAAKARAEIKRKKANKQ